MKYQVLAILFSLALTQNAAAETISVIVQKTTDVGTVRAAIYGSQAAFDADRIISGTASPAGEGQTLLSIENLTPGTYGIAVFHDQNGNEELDRNMLGAPNEPFGFSNNPIIGFSAPRFETFAFEFSGSPLELVITLNGN